MTKKRKIIIVIVIIVIIGALLALQNRNVTKAIAEKAIELASEKMAKDLEKGLTLIVSSRSIDSLYDANTFQYFLAIDNKESSMPTLDSLTAAKTLVFYNNKNFTEYEIKSFIKDKMANLLFPSYVFDIIVPNNKATTLYTIVSVEKERAGSYSYKIAIKGAQ